MKAIRGAISIQTDTPEQISLAVNQLFSELCKRNNLNENDFVCLIFSHTKDLRSLNSATALRQKGKCSNVPLFCVQEADISGALPQVIRIMALTDKNLEKVSHVYLGKTAILRPDLTEQDP